MPDTAEVLRTVLGRNKDPREVMRSIAKFASENRGVAEIRDHGKLIGYVVLCKRPEEDSTAIYDCTSRAIEHMPLADWLRARGYEASACRWEEIDRFLTTRPVILGDMRWMLQIVKPAVPKSPPLSRK